ncbi:ATP-binding protein [Streptomyces sp. TRM68367]|uniref:ATP-binding protein n=1 Tax=Streptomyces sp. TRM68367 TaxID=2758415 RepID=UPI00165A151E|nr:ATP-binding protein [Streptomyces sp. TRM68367]MBC9730955.1 ATP-binding protein [Streptomyces sp. TRM68367]
MGCMAGVLRKPWDLPFIARPEEVAALRRVMRLHLGLWGLYDVIDDAQLCVSELVANVITHVGAGTPATLAVSMSDTRLRIEVHDPDARALPVLVAAGAGSEAGRGIALIDAVAVQWGVQLTPEKKVTWCELATGLSSADGPCGGPRVTRVEALLIEYPGGGASLAQSATGGVLAVVAAEHAAVDLIADVLHWLRAHGCDADTALDRAQTHFEAEISESEGNSK